MCKDWIAAWFGVEFLILSYPTNNGRWFELG